MRLRPLPSTRGGGREKVPFSTSPSALRVARVPATCQASVRASLGRWLSFLPPCTVRRCRKRGPEHHSLGTGTPELGSVSLSFPLVRFGGLTRISKKAAHGCGERTSREAKLAD